MPKMNTEPIQVGTLLMQRIHSSSVDYRARHKGGWHGVLCPWNAREDDIPEVGKLIKVNSWQQLDDERCAYRDELGVGGELHLAYYEVIDDSAEQ